MKLDKLKKIKRLVIYFFYDADGIVDRYVPYMLEDINKNCSELFVVVNGKLTKEGRDTFKKLTPNILVRENVGFDVWAYKTALEHYGWDKLTEYDELILMNHTIMGPIYPFSEMFDEMNKRDLDFWGITKYHKHQSNPYGIKYGYIPEHIQSHFIAVRQSMVSSLEFQTYWDERPEIRNYDDAVGKHEAIFTKHFSDIGFVWECYVDTNDFDKIITYPLMYLPVQLLRDYRCPIFKRKSFFLTCSDYYSHSEGRQAKDLLKYLKDKTNFDVSMVWENLLRTCHMSDIKNCLNLNYIIPQNYCVDKNVKANLALVIHIYFKDLIEYCFRYALSMPDDSDIFITTDTEEKAKEIERVFGDGHWRKVKIILIENRGRDVSALLIGAAPYLEKYKCVCFMHDKKSAHFDYTITGADFSDRCFENMLGSRDLVLNIASTFAKNPQLGLLCPPPPNHAEYYSTTGDEWGDNYEATKQLYEKLELNIPMDISHEPIAPLGTMFWFRPKALKKLFAKKWKYDDFPKEPNKTDGTILHAIERIYPFIAQEAGFYSAWGLADEYARLEWSKLAYCLRETNVRLFRLFAPNNFYGTINTMDYYINNPKTSPVNLRLIIKSRIKKWMPKPIWNLLKRTYHFFGGKKWIG